MACTKQPEMAKKMIPFQLCTGTKAKKSPQAMWRTCGHVVVKLEWKGEFRVVPE